MGAKNKQNAVQNFLVVISVLGSDLLTGVVFYLGGPAAAITPVERSAVDLCLGAATDITRDEGTEKADFDVTEATEEACLEVRHVTRESFRNLFLTS